MMSCRRLSSAPSTRPRVPSCSRSSLRRATRPISTRATKCPSPRTARARLLRHRPSATRHHPSSSSDSSRSRRGRRRSNRSRSRSRASTTRSRRRRWCACSNSSAAPTVRDLPPGSRAHCVLVHRASAPAHFCSHAALCESTAGRLTACAALVQPSRWRSTPSSTGSRRSSIGRVTKPSQVRPRAYANAQRPSHHACVPLAHAHAVQS
jgi:hypothetical protein